VFRRRSGTIPCQEINLNEITVEAAGMELKTIYFKRKVIVIPEEMKPDVAKLILVKENRGCKKGEQLVQLLLQDNDYLAEDFSKSWFAKNVKNEWVVIPN